MPGRESMNGPERVRPVTGAPAVAGRTKAARGAGLEAGALDLERRCAYRFARLSALTLRSIAALLRRQGLSERGWRMLSLIGHHEPVHPGALARRTSVEPDKVTRAVDHLVEQGLAVRRVDPADRRRVMLRLTAKGRTVYRRIEAVRRRMEVEFLGVLNPAEQKAFLRALDRLEAQAERMFALPP